MTAPCCERDFDNDGNCDRHPRGRPRELLEEKARMTFEEYADLRGRKLHARRVGAFFHWAEFQDRPVVEAALDLAQTYEHRGRAVYLQWLLWERGWGPRP